MRVFLVLFILLFFANLSFADISVGVSPPVLELGELEPGETKLVEFNLITSSEDILLVYLGVEKGNLDFFISKTQYSHLIPEYSYESIEDWVSVVNSPVEISKPKGSARGRKPVSFLLHVPEDAEPGYHLISIIPKPVAPSEDIGGAGAVMVSTTSINVLFRVAGEVDRKGIILDTVYRSYDNIRVGTDTYFQNTGTNTMLVRAYQEMYQNNSLVASSSSQKAVSRPGEVTVLSTLLPTGRIEYGNYDIYTKVDYTTGYAEKNSTIPVYALPVAPMVVMEEPVPVLTIAFVVILIVVLLFIIRKMRRL